MKHCKGAAILGLLAMLGSLFGCKPDKPVITSTSAEMIDNLVGSDGAGEQAADNDSGIVRFYYSYNGSIGADSYSYSVTKENDRVVFTYEGMQDRDYGELSTEVPQSVLDELYGLYRSYRLAEWNGWNKSNPDMLDGDGFSLSIKFGDNSRMSAGGENAWPKGYGEFKAKMNELLDPIRDKLKEEKRREIIKCGVSGTLKSVMINLIQRGNAGRDEYFALITAENIRSTNVELRVKSVSGELFPQGEYKLYNTVPDEVIDLASIQALIEKYDVIEWYDYNEVAKDPNNEEWYQVNFSFDNDLTISSMGTKHPKHYDKLRGELLKWIKNLVDTFE